MLTQAEFCLCMGISRTSLWRYCKSPRSCSGFRSKPDVRRPLVADGWRNEAMKLCEKHVTYGYRRIQILPRKAGYEVGFHRVREWMRESGLAQTSPVTDEGRTPGEKPADPTAPNQAWQIDATKIYTKLDVWAWQTSILDVFDRRIVAHVVRKTCKAEDAMDVLAMALDSSFGDSKADGLSLIHDRWSQFTAWKFKEMVSNASVTNVAVAVCHPQSCGCLERYHRTKKEECIWLTEWESFPGLVEGVAEYVEHYNNHRIHSALEYNTPMETHRLAMENKSHLSRAA